MSEQERGSRGSWAKYPESVHIRLPEGIKERMNKLAERHGRDPSDEYRAAIFTHLRQLEDDAPEQPAGVRNPLETAADLRRLAAAIEQIAPAGAGEPATPAAPARRGRRAAG